MNTPEKYDPSLPRQSEADRERSFYYHAYETAAQRHGHYETPDAEIEAALTLCRAHYPATPQPAQADKTPVAHGVGENAVSDLCRRVRLALFHLERGDEKHEHIMRAMCRDLREGEQAVTAASSGAQEGWRLVPDDPTDEMIQRGLLLGNTPNQVTIIYQSMIQAAAAPGGDHG